MIRQISQDVGINLKLEKQVHGYWKCEPIQYICCDEEKRHYLLMVAVNQIQGFLFEQEITKYNSYHFEMKMVEIVFHGFIGYRPYILYKLPNNYRKIRFSQGKKKMLTNKIKYLDKKLIMDIWLDILPEETKIIVGKTDVLKRTINELDEYNEAYLQVKSSSRNINSAILDKENKELQIFAIDFIYIVEIEKICRYQKQLLASIKRTSENMYSVEIQEVENKKIMVCPNIHFNTPSVMGKKCIHFVIIEWNNVTEIEVEVVGRKARIFAFLMPISYLAINKLIKYLFFKYKVILIEYDNILYALGVYSKVEQAIIHLPQNADELRRRNSSKTRYNIRREKRLIEEEVGKYSIEIYEKNDIPDEIVQKYFDYKKASHGRNFGISAQEYIQLHNVSSVYVMRAGEKILAMCLSCESNYPNIYFENFSYSPELKKLSLGSVMYDIYLEKLIERKAEYVFLGNGQYEYKRKYGSQYIVCYTGKKYRYMILDKMNYFCRVIITFINKMTHI